MELIARRTIVDLEGEEGLKHVEEYSDGTTERGKRLRQIICDQLHLSTLDFQSIKGIVEAIGLRTEDQWKYPAASNPAGSR